MKLTVVGYGSYDLARRNLVGKANRREYLGYAVVGVSALEWHKVQRTAHTLVRDWIYLRVRGGQSWDDN